VAQVNGLEEVPRRDHLSPAARSAAMAKVRSRNTKPELVLRRALWRRGLRGWRCNVSNVPGRPDIAFPRWKVAVFVDGLLWHGHPIRYPAALDATWRAKIARNVERDLEVNERLAKMNWRVVRLWDRDVIRQTQRAVEQVMEALQISGVPESPRLQPDRRLHGS
jgi:DNA mismatch endonuclease, patch repair protein